MKREICQIISEYRRFRETGRLAPKDIFPLPDGSSVEFCHSNGIDVTLCVLRAGDRALTPVAIGDDVPAVMACYKKILTVWDPALWPPPRVVVEGTARVFAPAGMSHLLGVAELRYGALLLGVVKRGGKGGLAVLRVDGGRLKVVHFGEPMDLRAVDVDGLIELQDGALHAETGELGAGLLAAFARLLARAIKPRKQVNPRHRGAGSIRLFLWALVQLVRMGADDLCGRRSDIQAQLKVLLPGLDLPTEALAGSLNLMLAARTCLVTCAGRAIWHIRLADLRNLESALYRKFCAEAPRTAADVGDFARVCAGDTPPPRSKCRGTQSRRSGTQQPGVGDPLVPDGKRELGAGDSRPREERELGAVHGSNAVVLEGPAGAPAGADAKLGRGGADE